MKKTAVPAGPRSRSVISTTCFPGLLSFILLAFILAVHMFSPTLVLAARKADSGPAKIEKGNLFAIVVGVSKFRDPKIPRLNLANKDANAFGKFLETQNKIFEKTQVTYLLDEKATKSEIEKHLYYTLPKAGKKDTIILFFSGHGSYDPMRPKDFLFLAYDSEPDYLSATAVKMSGLDFLKGIEADRVLIIADACHAGGFSRMRAKTLSPSMELFLKEVKNSSGRAVITSGTGEQLSWELPNQDHSVFTHNLIEGLEGKADRDHDGVVTLNEVYRYTYGRTKEQTSGHQHPQFEGKIVGEFPLSHVGPPLSPRELRKMVMDMARTGNAAKLKRLIDSGAVMAARDDANDTPLIISARHGHTAVVKLLVDKRVDVDDRNNSGTTALPAACENGHTEAVRLLLAAGAKVNVKDCRGLCPLAVACKNGHLPVAELLIANDADLRARTNQGKTVLGLAAAEGRVQVVKYLLEIGSDPNCRDLAGRTALIDAARNGHGKVVKLLLENRAGISMKSGGHPEKQLMLAVLRDNLSGVRQLIVRGANANAQEASCETPLTLAAGLVNHRVMKYLLSHGADLNGPAHNQVNPLLLSAKAGRASVVKVLLAAGADSGARDERGNTALMLAARRGHTKVVRVLARKQHNLNARNVDQRTALMQAAESNHADAVSLLSAAGADVNATDRNGATALMLGCKRGHVRVVELLATKESLINAQNKMGCTPLMLAAANGHKTVVKALRARGADTWIKDWEGKTASDLASERGLKEVAALLASR